MRRMKTNKLFAISLLFCILLTSCQAAQATPPASLFPGEALTPFATGTSTPTVTATPEYAPTATLAPTLTPTPMTYTVKANDTLFEIAANFGLTTDQIKAANPSVNPYLLDKGMVIIIPAAGSTPAATQGLPASTPYLLSFGEAQCTPSLTGGLYCFAEVHNDQQAKAGNISAEFRLTDPASGDVLTQKALVPLNRIAAGGSLPVFAYFTPPVFAEPQVSLQLQTAMSIDTASAVQSATVRIEESDIQISANGLSAVVNVTAALDASEGVNANIWIAAAAYDNQGNIVGIRRYQSGEALNAGGSTAFTLNIYSIGGKIEKVDLFGEANP